MSIQVSARETLAWSSLAPAVALAVVLGAAIIYVSGHLQTTALHDAAHDVRHATGFPCH
ncbi:MAG: CbtB domain-containing protein [Marinibacterium sp.]